MIGTFKKSLEIYNDFSGTSMMFVWFLISMFYIWMTEKEKNIKIMFCYLLAALGILFFIPGFSYIAMKYFLDSQTYYRFLWLLPTGAVVSYACVKMISGIPSPQYRKIMVLCGILGMMVFGNCIYSNKSVTMASNIYKLPQDVIGVADVMHVEGRDVTAAVPAEMLQFIRQYDPSINLAYGRDALVEGWSGNPLYNAMESVPMRSWQVGDTARQQNVEYLVIRTGTPIAGSRPLSGYEFSYLTTTGIYDIYIFDRAEFADQKKEEYKNTGIENFQENWIDTSEE